MLVLLFAFICFLVLFSFSFLFCLFFLLVVYITLSGHNSRAGWQNYFFFFFCLLLCFILFFILVFLFFVLLLFFFLVVYITLAGHIGIAGSGQTAAGCWHVSPVQPSYQPYWHNTYTTLHRKPFSLEVFHSFLSCCTENLNK